jgi:uncharacterized protein YacL
VVFIEVFRLILVLLGALAGMEIGHQVDASPAPVVGMVLGALVSYVAGGVLGRYLERLQSVVVERIAPRVPPGELFAGTLTGIAGLLLGAAACLPLLALVRGAWVYAAAAAVVWLLTWAGFRLGMAKGRQVVAAAGLSRILAPPIEPPPGYAVLADASAIMDHSLLVLGRSGLLVGGLVVPRFAVDQLQTLATSPDAVSSRRARRGLESLEALREHGVPVHIAENELPEIEDLDDRLLEIARRLGLRLVTTSGTLCHGARRRGLAVTDLRRLADSLSPDHPPGEQLLVDLEREGNQPLQAVGYLPDGDMVVVNHAAHMIGRQGVGVEVLSTRKTSQGLLVFGKLADSPSDAGAGDAVAGPGSDQARGRQRGELAKSARSATVSGNRQAAS